jgi:subtilase family serine protease
MRKHKRAALAAALLAVAGAVAASVAFSSASHAAALPLPRPDGEDTPQFVKAGTAPPTAADCIANVGVTCFGPQAVQSAYDVGPLYATGLTGKGVTIAIIDSYGSDTIAHDLHVYDQAFGIQAMCGEEGVTCQPGMPTFSQLSLNGTPATVSQPGNGTHIEDKSAWAAEVTLDVETSHAIAPGANILLVHTNTAETLGVQGFPQMMKAEDYVVKNHLADVISQSFGSSELAFGSPQSLLNLRFAFQDAQAAGVTVLASSGDDGTSNLGKTPVPGFVAGTSFIETPTVNWPASDPLVTGVGGTYLCTDPNATVNQPRTNFALPNVAAKCRSNGPFNPGGKYAEVAWTFSGGGFSSIFGAQPWQTTPAGSYPIGNARGVPDVALQASSATGALIYLSLGGDGSSSNVSDSTPGWYVIGGTSLACPQWAGLVAIADQLNGKPLGFINPALYKIGADPTRYANDFFDIATGNTNQEDPAVPGYPSVTGWDAVTGLGTPNAAKLVPDLVKAANGS